MGGRFTVSLLVMLTALMAAAPFDLDREQWRHRVLLVFSPATDAEPLRQQRSILARDRKGMQDRDLLVVEVIRTAPTEAVPAKVAESLRLRLRAAEPQFTAILVGKDGAVKLRRTEPVALQELYEIIDVMPMRRDELKERQKP